MGEFTDVMKQWGRMCRHYSDKTDSCNKCPMRVEHAAICSAYAKDNAVNSKDIELMVTDWAKKNPEPVKVTWSDYFGYHWWDPIPDDIAEKLGIEPKEST